MSCLLFSPVYKFYLFTYDILVEFLFVIMHVASFLTVVLCNAFISSTIALSIHRPGSSAAINNDRVNFTIYYETLCADCRQFIITQVWFAYQAVAEIVNLTFIPYGNAQEIYRPETQLYQFYCQHGADECYANLIHV